MAQRKITVIQCDRCGFEGEDLSQFFHFTMTELKKTKVIKSLDYCLTCTGEATDKKERTLESSM